MVGFGKTKVDMVRKRDLIDYLVAIGLIFSIIVGAAPNVYDWITSSVEPHPSLGLLIENSSEVNACDVYTWNIGNKHATNAKLSVLVLDDNGNVMAENNSFVFPILPKPLKNGQPVSYYITVKFDRWIPAGDYIVKAVIESDDGSRKDNESVIHIW